MDAGRARGGNGGGHRQAGARAAQGAAGAHGRHGRARAQGEKKGRREGGREGKGRVRLTCPCAPCRHPATIVLRHRSQSRNRIASTSCATTSGSSFTPWRAVACMHAHTPWRAVACMHAYSAPLHSTPRALLHLAGSHCPQRGDSMHPGSARIVLTAATARCTPALLSLSTTRRQHASRLCSHCSHRGSSTMHPGSALPRWLTSAQAPTPHHPPLLPPQAAWEALNVLCTGPHPGVEAMSEHVDFVRSCLSSLASEARFRKGEGEAVGRCCCVCVSLCLCVHRHAACLCSCAGLPVALPSLCVSLFSCM